MVRGAAWLFASALLICPTRVRSGRSTASLFELVQQVTEVSPESFSVIAESSVPWVLDCYSPGCPHCVRFAPTWEKVGTTLRDSTIKVGAVNCMKHRDLCQLLEVGAFPTLMALNSPDEPQGTAANPAIKKLDKKSNSYDGVMDLIIAEFPGALEGTAVAGADVVPARELGQDGSVLDTRVDNVGWGGAPCILRIEDATVSVRFILRNEVFIAGAKLSKDRMGVLLSFLDLLATTFPGKMNRASFRSLAAELRSDPGLNDIARWDKRIGNLHIGSFPPTKEDNWPAANIERGTEEHVLHYTSGLWSLLHVLSVSSAPMRQHPYAVMEGIHSFVDNFFRCQVCHSHFLEMYSGCDNERCKIQRPGNVRGQQTSEAEPALALWVWRMHNAVNARLAQEGDEEDVEPHGSLWPSAKICKECWSGYPLQEDQPSWSETEVLKLLQGTFSCPEAVGEGPDAPGRSWAVTCVLVCAAAAVLMWARKWVEMRGIGLSKKRVDAIPSL